MQVHVVRSPAVKPGGARWSSLGSEEILLFVSAASVSADGAHALEAAWAEYIDRGIWRYQDDEGAEPVSISATYRVGRLPAETVLRVVEQPRGHYEVTLSDRDFSTSSAAGVERCVGESIDHGWTYHQALQPIDIRQVG